MRQAYPSDITRKQSEKIREGLESAKKNTHPRKYDLYGISCAVLYLLKEGCTSTLSSEDTKQALK